MIASITAYTLTTSFALLALKAGSSSGQLISIANGRPILNLTFYSILGIVLYAVSFILYTVLIARYNLGYIVPLVTGLVYVVVFGMSFILNDEPFTAIKLFGILLILGGVYALSVQGS